MLSYEACFNNDVSLSFKLILMTSRCHINFSSSSGKKLKSEAGKSSFFKKKKTFLPLY